MKKILFVAFITAAIAGCSKQKDERVCYYCVFGLGAGSSQEPPRTVCIEPWDDIEHQQFRDANGNDLNAYCEKK